MLFYIGPVRKTVLETKSENNLVIKELRMLFSRMMDVKELRHVDV